MTDAEAAGRYAVTFTGAGNDVLHAALIEAGPGWPLQIALAEAARILDADPELAAEARNCLVELASDELVAELALGRRPEAAA